MRRALASLSVLVAVLASTTACGGSASSSGSGDPLTTMKIAVTISGDTVSPNGDTIDVKVNQPIELDVTSDAMGEIHVHSEPEHQYEVPAGTHSYTFTIDRPGVVAVESHTLDKTIVQLQATP